jgi:polyhydroxyalkanoate synthesis regulator protein
MDNSYITQIAPYFGQQDQGLMPVFQNINAQQQFQNLQNQQGNQLTQQAGQTAQNSMSGLNPLAMAMALRKGNGITTGGTGVAYDANGQNPYSYTPQGPDYSQNIGNLINTRD